MRKALLLSLIITVLPALALSKEPAKVPFICIWGHQDQGPVLLVDYPKLYQSNETVNHYLPFGGGHSFQEQQIEYWLVGSIGYYMLKYDSWSVLMLDPYTDHTGQQVLDMIRGRKVIDITDNLIATWGSVDASKYVTLKAGRNLYFLPQYLNEWPLHLADR